MLAGSKTSIQVTPTSVVNANVTSANIDALIGAALSWQRLGAEEREARSLLLQVSPHYCPTAPHCPSLPFTGLSLCCSLSQESWRSGCPLLRLFPVPLPIDAKVSAARAVGFGTSPRYPSQSLVLFPSATRAQDLPAGMCFSWQDTGRGPPASPASKGGAEDKQGAAALDREDTQQLLLDNQLGAPLYARTALDGFGHTSVLPAHRTSSVQLPPLQFPELALGSAQLSGPAKAATPAAPALARRRFMALRLLKGEVRLVSRLPGLVYGFRQQAPRCSP